MTDEKRGREEEPEQDGGLFAEPASGPDEEISEGPEPPEPERHTDEVPASGPPPSDGGNEGAQRRTVWPWLVLGSLFALMLLVGWTKAVNSDAFCTRCHTAQAAADTAAHSIHSEVSCMSCHRGVGVPGAVAYIPTFAREVVDQLSPLPVARGTMDAAPCEKCHATIFATPLLEGEHPSTGCNECHGNTVHPPPPQPPTPISNPHPETWVDLHGREAARDLDTCATCHLLQQETGSTCMACHFRGGYPHPKDWIVEHGAQQISEGSDACTLCHPATFCASCHGTEIPHSPTWLEEHWRELQNGYPTTPCLTCHAQIDCERCHSLHPVHNQQRIYDRSGR